MGLLYSVLAIGDCFLVGSLAGKAAEGGINLVSRLVFGVYRNPSTASSATLVTHYTNAAGAQGMAITGKIGGQWGIFAVEGYNPFRTVLLRRIFAFVGPEVRQWVVTSAGHIFTKPPWSGLFSAYRRLAGWRSTPLGSYNLATGQFIKNEIFIVSENVFRQAATREIVYQHLHQFLLDYGIDALILYAAHLLGAVYDNIDEIGGLVNEIFGD